MKNNKHNNSGFDSMSVADKLQFFVNGIKKDLTPESSEDALKKLYNMAKYLYMNGDMKENDDNEAVSVEDLILDAIGLINTYGAEEKREEVLKRISDYAYWLYVHVC